MSKISLKKINKEVVDKRNKENILIGLFILILIRLDNKNLSISYKSIKDKIVYDEISDEKAELVISRQLKERRVKKSGISIGKINNSEIKEGWV